ncbi:hypothetical protein HBA54_04140 [Pelagibius litoralis]|uniref:Uncharacterized protein n=1 Tax=Pelagibius litoralis TaxID=374515 RepID=A0A967EUZ5_9PROT|nr:hypothetical protein [Pelagibius litoralis]NIA67772.1 hypothetical protein [Pelagibius litoralis]
MAITTKRLRLPAKLFDGDQDTQGFLQAVIDRIEKPRIEAVADLNITVNGPDSLAQLQLTINKVDELLAAIRTANILENS